MRFLVVVFVGCVGVGRGVEVSLGFIELLGIEFFKVGFLEIR